MKHVFALVHAMARVMILVLAVPAFGTEAPVRKDVLSLAARVADWQLAHMDAAHVTHFKEESRDPKSWEQGAFWVGMTRFADVSGEPRFRRAILDMGRANAWKPGPRLYHADDHVIAQSYLWAARHGAGAEAIAPLRASFDAILAKPAVAHLSFHVEKNYEDTACLRRWCWCDALFMSPPAWVDLSRQTGDPRYADFALKEFWRARIFSTTRSRNCTSATAASSSAAMTRAANFSGAAAMAGSSPASRTCSMRCRKTACIVHAWKPCFARWPQSSRASRNPMDTGRPRC